MRKPTPTTTTTTDPATDSYESNEKEESSDELKKLLLLIKNLGKPSTKQYLKFGLCFPIQLLGGKEIFRYLSSIKF